MISIKTIGNASDLVEEIKEVLSKDFISEWSVDTDGDYTLNIDPWTERAWMKCVLDETDANRLRIVIIGSRTQKMSRRVYGVYHGRFAELLLTLFDTSISEISITPLLEDGYDIFSRED